MAEEDKRSKAEKKRATNPERPEQKSDHGSGTMDKDAVLRRLEENEGYQEIIECMSEGSNGEVEQNVQSYLARIQKLPRLNKEQLEYLEGGVRRAVEARINGRCEEQEPWRQGEQGQNPGQEQSKQGKQVRFGEEEPLGETRA